MGHLQLKAQDIFGRTGPPDNFGRGDNFGRTGPPDNFGRGDNFCRTGPPDNFGMGDNFGRTGPPDDTPPHDNFPGAGTVVVQTQSSSRVPVHSNREGWVKTKQRGQCPRLTGVKSCASAIEKKPTSRLTISYLTFLYVCKSPM